MRGHVIRPLHQWSEALAVVEVREGGGKGLGVVWWWWCGRYLHMHECVGMWGGRGLM